MERIWGNWQYPGVLVTTTGNGKPKNETEALAPVVGVLGSDGETPASPSNPVPVDGTITVEPPVYDSIATNQVSVDNTAGGTQIVAARAGRQSVVIINHGTTDVYVGATGLTTSTGALLPGVKGAALTITGEAAVFGIVATGSQTVSYVESY